LEKKTKSGADMKIKLSNRRLDSSITKLHKDKHSDKDLNLMKVQAFILTYINEDRRNIVHLACYFGNLNLLSFLMERARFLQIDEEVIHAVDEMDLPPFYLLCERGYK
jgi:hypothetical protein